MYIRSAVPDRALIGGLAAQIKSNLISVSGIVSERLHPRSRDQKLSISQVAHEVNRENRQANACEGGIGRGTGSGSGRSSLRGITGGDPEFLFEFLRQGEKIGQSAACGQ